MRRMFLVLNMSAVILLWLAGARAKADLIQWTASGSPLGSGEIFPQNNVDAGVSLRPGNATSGTNSGSIVALKVGYYINPDALQMPTFGGSSANYSLSLTLHDNASGASGALTFSGNLSGSGATDGSVYLTNHFLGSTTQTLTLGRDLYTVRIGPYVNPTYNDFGSMIDYGSISASISVQPLANSTPEPSSLVLACLGLPSLGLTVLRRRQRIHSGAGWRCRAGSEVSASRC